MPLLLKYLNLSLMKPLSAQKSKYLTMSCSDRIGTKMVYLAILAMILATSNSTFFGRKSKMFLLKLFE